MKYIKKFESLSHIKPFELIGVHYFQRERGEVKRHIVRTPDNRRYAIDLSLWNDYNKSVFLTFHYIYDDEYLTLNGDHENDSNLLDDIWNKLDDYKDMDGMLKTMFLLTDEFIINNDLRYLLMHKIPKPDDTDITKKKIGNYFLDNGYEIFDMKEVDSELLDRLRVMSFSFFVLRKIREADPEIEI